MRLPPCVGEKGLDIFQKTADQRFDPAHPEVFLRTHFPTEMINDLDGGKKVGEDWLLSRLLDVPVIKGNRIFLVYGSPGTGKSELSKWLEVMIQQDVRAKDRRIVRVSRDELDILRIMEKLRVELDESFTSSTKEQWQKFKDQAWLLARRVVSGVLVRTDIPSTPAAQRFAAMLEEVVTRQLKRQFESQDDSSSPRHEVDRFLELVTVSDWRNVGEKSGFAHSLRLADVNVQLVREMKQATLENTDIADVLRRISEKQAPRRPVLLIDDLMKSYNFFAQEFLDALLKDDPRMAWDVVVGITPGALERTDAGADLARYLATGTVRNRIAGVLRLSDDSGHESHFIGEANCADFLSLYLQEYKRSNGYECGSNCMHYVTCRFVEFREDRRAKPGPILAPFNSDLIQRVLRSSRQEMGAARFLVASAQQIFRKLVCDHTEMPEALLESSVRASVIVEGPLDALERKLVAFYCPIDQPDGQMNVPAEFRAAFGFPAQDAEVTVYSGRRPSVTKPDAESGTGGTAPIEPGGGATTGNSSQLEGTGEENIRQQRITAIQEWLDGSGNPSKELLQNVRDGLATLIAQFLEPQYICSPHFVETGALAWPRQHQGLPIPTRLDGLREDAQTTGVLIPREQGLAVKADQIGAARRDETLERAVLTDEPSFARVLLSADALRDRFKMEASHCLGDNLDLKQFALYAYGMYLSLNAPANWDAPKAVITAFPSIRGLSSRALLDGLRHLIPIVDPNQLNAARVLFRSFFELRKDFFDGLAISTILESPGFSINEVLRRLASIPQSRLQLIPSVSKVGGVPFAKFVENVRHVATMIRALSTDRESQDYIDQFNAIEALLVQATKADLESILDSLSPVLSNLQTGSGANTHPRQVPAERFTEHLDAATSLMELIRVTCFQGIKVTRAQNIDPLRLTNFLMAMRELVQNPLVQWLLDFDKSLSRGLQTLRDAVWSDARHFADSHVIEGARIVQRNVILSRGIERVVNGRMLPPSADRETAALLARQVCVERGWKVVGEASSFHLKIDADSLVDVFFFDVPTVIDRRRMGNLIMTMVGDGRRNAHFIAVVPKSFDTTAIEWAAAEYEGRISLLGLSGSTDAPGNVTGRLEFFLGASHEFLLEFIAALEATWAISARRTSSVLSGIMPVLLPPLTPEDIDSRATAETLAEKAGEIKRLQNLRQLLAERRGLLERAGKALSSLSIDLETYYWRLGIFRMVAPAGDGTFDPLRLTLEGFLQAASSRGDLDEVAPYRDLVISASVVVEEMLKHSKLIDPSQTLAEKLSYYRSIEELGNVAAFRAIIGNTVPSGIRPFLERINPAKPGSIYTLLSAWRGLDLTRINDGVPNPEDRVRETYSLTEPEYQLLDTSLIRHEAVRVDELDLSVLEGLIRKIPELKQLLEVRRRAE